MAEEISKEDWERDQFNRVLSSLPPPCPVYDNTAICPWCGTNHETVTFGSNECTECSRSFFFGVPQWGSRVENRLETYVCFPWKEFEAVKGKALTIEPFKPTELLKKHYEDFQRIWPDQDAEKRPSDAALN